MSATFQESVARNLREVFFFSVGTMCGCDECGLSNRTCPSCDGDGKQFEHASDAPCPVCAGRGSIEPTEHERDRANEGGFSWSSCDSCGSHLGGNRYPAHGFIADTMEAAQSPECSATHFDVCADCLMFHANGELPDETERASK